MLNQFIKKLMNNQLFIFIFLSIIVFFFKLPTLTLPLHWDSLIDIAESAFVLINNTHGYSGYFFRHPPFPFLMLALCFKLFGTSYIVAKIFMMILSIISLFYVYKIGKFIYNGYVGILSALSYFFLPIFFSQTLMVNSITFIRPLFFMSIYYTLTKDIKKYIIFSCLLLLSRETELFTIIGTTIIWVLREKKVNWSLTLPFLLLILWAISNKILFGWFLFPSYVSFFSLSTTFFIRFQNYFYEIFFAQNRYILTLSYIIFSLILNKKLNSKESNFETLSLLIIISYLLFYSFTPNALPRYFVSLYGLIMILVYGRMQKTISINFCIFFFVILSSFFIRDWHGLRSIPPGWQLETNMEYTDVVITHMAATKFIENNYANATVLTCWPMTLELSNPFNGYTSKKISVQDYLSNKSTENIQIIYFSAQSNCYTMLNEINRSLFVLEGEFQKNGKISQIFRRV